MRNTFSKKITQYADKGEDFTILSADLGYSVFDDFRKKYPEKFFNAGIAENTMVGVAAGLAMAGKKVFIYSISKFLANKCFEHIREDICYHDVPVVMVGTGSGFSYGQAGHSHYSNEDIGCLRAIPGLTIVSPIDPTELEVLLDQSLTYPHPVYFRLGKNGEQCFSKKLNLKIGQAYYLEKEKDIALITHGNIIDEVAKARDLLKKDGFNVSIISSPTIKPLDKKFFEELMRDHANLYVIEEHSEIGGLGDALAYLGAKKIAVKDEAFYKCGDPHYLRKMSGLNAEAIYLRVKKETSLKMMSAVSKNL
ncbi:MAG: transketolase C-terminal domain-containing protein [Desulfocapsaceae bacterium]|nr:transketolase C-terminal domain-containing protein [Desulfocapsaceae bacterium]